MNYQIIILLSQLYIKPYFSNNFTLYLWSSIKLQEPILSNFSCRINQIYMALSCNNETT